MKKTFLLTVLSLIIVFALSACGKEEAKSLDELKEGEAEVKKITIMVDNTVVNTANGQNQFKEALEALWKKNGYNVELTIIQPDHTGYYDTVSQTFASPDVSTWPDIVLLGAAYYVQYADSGILQDISSYYEGSDFKASGRCVNEELINSLYMDGKLYGLAPTRGNGCITYVRQAWLDQCGLKAPTNYEEYKKMAEAFTALSPEGYAITSAGIVNKEAPYVNYLPEFFQDAYPDFYEKDGKWVDGFTEQSMRDALTRLTEAYTKGWLDPECASNGTSACRNKFYADSCGVFTYWAGTWAYNLATNLEAKGLDSRLVALEPIAEVGQYIERQTTVWGITKACKSPATVFDIFFSSMFDGDEGQILWTYGVEDVHWSTKAETVVINAGAATEKQYESKEGEFHFRANLENAANLYTKNHIDPMLRTFNFKTTPIGNNVLDERAQKSADIFFNNCRIAPVIMSNSVMEQYQAEIMSLRISLVAEVVTNGMSIDDAMAQYNAEQGEHVQAILDSLNR